MKENNKHKEKAFWIREAVLMAMFLILFYVAVGYKTIALSLFAITALVGIYRLLSNLGKKNAKLARTLKIVLTAFVCIGLVLFAVIEVIVVRAAHTDTNPEAPYLIMLGAGVNGTEPSLSMLYRLEESKKYLDEYPEAIAIVSGGQGAGEDISEAECMRRWLAKNGVSADRIIMEDKSTSTYENLRNSLEIIEKRGGDRTAKVAVLSQEYHLYRAKYYARELGADAVGVAASTGNKAMMVSYTMREAFGVAYMWILEHYLGHA
ncbi:MAG: YdcF family protein [Oscillospiraceae bacterium]